MINLRFHPAAFSFILAFMRRPVVIVMVKAPIAGFAKTRLTPPLSEADAVSLASCFVQDVINSSLHIVPHLIVAFSPGNGRAVLEVLLPADLHWIEQLGKDLGERLDAAIAYAVNLGCGPIIVIGADSPTLPQSFLETALDALATAQTDAVLGPTLDGGYYLLGLRNRVPQLFQNIDWSTPLTYEQTVSNISGLGLHLLELPQWYDVDTFSDLLRLREELLSDDKARLRAPATYNWLLGHDLLLQAPG